MFSTGRKNMQWAHNLT